MHVVDDVPLLPSFTSLMDALGAMRSHQRSAVVRESQTGWALIQIPDLFDGLVQRRSQLSNISISAPVYRITAADVSKWNLDLNDPKLTEPAYEQLLDSVGYLYGFMKSIERTASIVTRHEPLADPILAVPRQCQCRGPLRHSFPLPHVSTGQLCPYCGATIDCF